MIKRVIMCALSCVMLVLYLACPLLAAEVVRPNAVAFCIWAGALRMPTVRRGPWQTFCRAMASGWEGWCALAMPK